MDRSERADIFCVAISSGKVPVLLEDLMSEETTWAVVSATSPSNSETRYLGISRRDKRCVVPTRCLDPLQTSK